MKNKWRIKSMQTDWWEFVKGPDEITHFGFSGLVFGTVAQRKRIAMKVLSMLNSTGAAK